MHAKHTVLIIKSQDIFIPAWLCRRTSKRKVHLALDPGYFIVINFELCESSISPELASHNDVMAASTRDQTDHVAITARPSATHLTEEYLVIRVCIKQTS